MNKILEVSNLTKHYGSGSVLTKALDGISLELASGEFVAIMGASGSGKSTLLNVIATIDGASSGTVKIDGQNVCDMREDALSAFRRDKLGFIFQDYNLLDTLTVEENIVLPLNLQRKTAQETERELRKAAAALGIESQLKKFPHELSGGQRQRAACARAIITSRGEFSKHRSHLRAPKLPRVSRNKTRDGRGFRARARSKFCRL